MTIFDKYVTYTCRTVDMNVRDAKERYDAAVAYGAWGRLLKSSIDDYAHHPTRLVAEIASIRIRTAMYYRALAETDIDKDWAATWLQV